MLSPHTPRTRPSDSRSTSTIDSHNIFFPLLALVLVLWLIYRSVFTFPEWFDETIGKALFFGLPVWFYVVATNISFVADSFAPRKFFPGLYLGLAVGGVYGFTTSLLTLWQTGAVPQTVYLFSSNVFWYEFGLAMLTGFWETILFFSFVLGVLVHKYPRWGLLRHVLLTAVIFLVFHVPNTIARFQFVEIAPQLLLLLLFSIGQALLFYEQRNSYALVLSHAIWGMVLLTHSW